ncbi:hypothetical protein [Nonomuraea sp. SYSU D8015]|uniref:hypothetical protein n=1 Tax=Nonomuraea sp. SYSU D8015 TaxID=2593644 RepID=UPI0016609262|nr:hypothetical protein [Nonomuraea sp. SYSU D8015]
MRFKPGRCLGVPAAGATVVALLGPVPAARAVPCPSGQPPSTPCDTVVTFEVSSGALGMTAPSNVTLAYNAPARQASGSWPAGDPVTVIDNRNGNLAWTCTVVSTPFTATGQPNIPPSQASYSPGTASTNNGTVTSRDANGMATPTEVVEHDPGTGSSATTWVPTMTVDVPLQNGAATYTGTVTHSVTGG